MPNGTVIIPLGRNAKYGTLTVDWDRFNDDVRERIFDYGLRQKLNDAMATKTDKDGNDLSDEAIVKKATDCLANLYEGVWRTRAEGEPADPFEAECYREAKRTVLASRTFKENNKDVPKKTKDRFMFVVNRLRAAAGKPECTEADYIAEVLATAAGDNIRKRAKATLAQRAKDAEADLF